MCLLSSLSWLSVLSGSANHWARVQGYCYHLSFNLIIITLCVLGVLGEVMEWQWLKDWWRLKRWRNKKKKEQNDYDFCYCDECLPDVRFI